MDPLGAETTVPAKRGVCWHSNIMFSTDCSLPSALEWQGPKTDSYLIYIQLHSDKMIKVLDSRLSVLRSINLHAQQQLDVILSNNKGNKALLLKIPKEYDLVRSVTHDMWLVALHFTIPITRNVSPTLWVHLHIH